MRVLMQGRIELLESGGGDKVQIVNTSKELKKLGVEVDISTRLDQNVEHYDLVHVFQLDWTPETYFYAKKAKEAKKPLVLSPIHHSIKEVKKFDDEYVFDFRRVAKVLFQDQHKRDTFKNVYRSIFDPRKFKPTFASIILGLESMHRKTLSYADAVLVQTEAEARDLKATYGVDFYYEVVVNGVGEQFLVDSKSYDNKLETSDYVLCVGRIEARKNQINIIKAMKKFREMHKSDTNLVFIGEMSSRKHFEYIRKFKRLLEDNPWIKYVGSVAYEDIPSYYHHAKVCVSASWFETTGLTSLEALFCGTNAVASGERAREYLGTYASYCEPNDVNSILVALEKEYFAPRPVIPSSWKDTYTWKRAAEKTLAAYRRILKDDK